jgi:hypothetical protein
MTTAYGTRIAWSNQPSGVNWDPLEAMRWAPQTSARKLVPLGTLLKMARQGVVTARLDSGDVAVEVARVTDIQRIIPGTGERRFVSPSILSRHTVEIGDVLVPRVGRHGRACCISSHATPIVPGEGLFMARPKRREWGSVIAAALCTSTVKRWLGQLLTTDRVATLTKDRLSEIPVPSPTQFDFGQIVNTVDQASAEACAGKEALDRVRGEVGLILERAPTALFRNHYQWLPSPDGLQGWCWQNVQRHWLLDRAQWQVRGLKPLCEVVTLSSHRAKTIVEGNPVFMLGSSDVRPTWYLALPEPSNHQEAEFLTSQPGSARKRFFAIHRECLLIPTVGNILSEPAVIPEEVLQRGTGPLMVPIHWLPLIGLRYPRAMAIVLDHPFGRLQRQLGAAFSTAPHITRETIENLLIPALPEAQWHVWEEQLCWAEKLFIEALTKAKQAVALVEEWYA